MVEKRNGEEKRQNGNPPASEHRRAPQPEGPGREGTYSSVSVESIPRG